MKKILSVFAAVALAATVFVACSSEAADDGRNSYIDTYKLDAVDITVKAYPGYNFVSWGSSKDGVTPTILRDDGKTITVSAGYTNAAIDADIKNGVKYTYTAYVVPQGTEVKSANDNVKVNGTGSATNTSNEYKTYWAAKGNSKSASVTAIGLDHYNSKGELTTALDLTNCQNAGDKKYVISDKNLIYKKVTDEIGIDHLYVSFPTKAYLQYEVYFYKGNSFDTYFAGLVGTDKKDNVLAGTDSITNKFRGVSVYQNFYKMDGTVNKDVATKLSAGTWKAVVKVSAPGTGYVDSYVFAKDTVTIDAVDANTATADVHAGYIDNGKTIRVIWTAAQNSNNKDWAAANYKVYVADGVNKASSVYTALTGEIKTDKQADKTVYYTEYAVTDNTAPYTFWVVLSDKDKVESTIPSATVNAYAKLNKVNFVTSTPAAPTDDTATASLAAKDTDGVTNDAILTINVPSNKGVNASEIITVEKVYAKKVAANDNRTWTVNNLILDSEITEVVVAPSADYTKYEAIVKDVAVDTKIVFLYTLKQANHANLSEVRSTVVVTGAPSILTGEFATPTDATGSAGENYKFEIVVTPGAENGTTNNYNAKENYEYKVFYAKVEDEASVANVTKWEEASVDIKWNTDLTPNRWCSVKTQDVSGLFEDEYGSLDSSGKPQKTGKAAKIAFKYVKTSKATKLSAVSYEYIGACRKN